tara:strand:- start:632 stop:1300 length:669 start_codon:yes stop_codon:yes gene_type:complete
MTGNFIVSYPRSGQHLMELLLKDAYKFYGMKYSYCGYYRSSSCGCRKNPCIKKRVFQKNHDFQLKMKIYDKYKYLILYREDYINQLEAYFRFTYRRSLKGKARKRFRKNGRWSNDAFDYEDPKLFNKLIQFIKEKKNSYDNFIKKWVNNDHPNCLHISYEKLLKTPVENTAMILRFFNPDKNFELEDVSNLLANRDETIEIRYQLCSKVYSKIQYERNGIWL